MTSRFLPLLALACGLAFSTAHASNTPQTLPFSQDWSNVGLITTNDDWSGVPGIVGFRGDGLAGTTGTNPQTVLGEGAPVVDVNANQTNPTTFNTGGVTEYQIANPTIGLTGSGTGQAPGIVLYLDTTGQSSINVSYTLRDLESSADDAQQQFALQYRIGASGNFTDLPGGYVADATTANSATQVTPVSVTLPAAANNQPLVQVRILTSNAVGNDENVGVDDISVTAGGAPATPSFSIGNVTADEGNSGTTAFTFTVTLNNPNGAESSVFVSTADGTAGAGSDYTAISGQQLIFTGAPAGTTQTQTVTVLVNGDTTNEPNETFSVTLSGASNASLAGAAATGTITNDDVAAAGPRIYEIQGAGHRSTMLGPVTGVVGIVTGVQQVPANARGFFMQDATGDGNVNTSDGIFVFTGSTIPGVTIGQTVSVSGTVVEFRAGGASSSNLTLTEISGPSVVVTDAGNNLASIVPVTIGLGGRIPPPVVVEDDVTGGNDVELAAGAYDPDNDALDFYESLEGMRVQVNNSRVVSPTSVFTSAGSSSIGDERETAEFWVVGDAFTQSDDAPNARGGLTLTGYEDQQPERIQIDTKVFLTGTIPLSGHEVVTVGDSFPAGAIVGVLGYDFGNFELLYTQALPPRTPGGLQRTTATLAGSPTQLTVAGYNVENLDPTDGAARFAQVASEVVDRIGSPDILSISEVQDNNGADSSGGSAANLTLDTLVTAIRNHGGVNQGPVYDYRQVDPTPGTNGGEPGGNIRVALLFRPDRVTFVAGTGGAGDAATPTAVTTDAGGLNLTLSPGLIDPTNTVFNSSRKPLAGVFEFNGRRVIVVGNHLNSKGGDGAVFGRIQPPVRSSETQRNAQARVINGFVGQALAADPDARVVVLGDLNDFAFSDALSNLRTGGPLASPGSVELRNLGAELEPSPNERHSYVFNGVSQELDHILVTEKLRDGAEFEVVRINSEFSDQTSDHDPLVSLLTVQANQPPLANAGTDRTVDGGAAVTLDGSGSSDADGGIIRYLWTQTAGTPVTLTGADTANAGFTAPDPAGTLSFTLTVTDDEGATGMDSVDVIVAADLTPDAFAFTDVVGIAPGSLVLSDAITVTGINAAAPISVTGGFYSLNGEATCARVSGLVELNDQVRVCHSASASFSTAVDTTLTIGADGILAGVSDTFTSTTAAAPADTTPDAFQFQDRLLLLPLPARYTSNVVTISGITAPTPITVSGRAEPMYSINGGAFRSSPGVVNNGDRVQLRTRYPAFDFRPPYLQTDTTLTVGGVADTWIVRLKLLP